MPRRFAPAAFIAGSLIAIGSQVRADPPPAITLVIWYDRARPFETFRHRAYDVQKGEYTKAVDDWRALMARDYPGYSVAVRDLPAAGGDPAHRIAAAVEDEKLMLARSILAAHSNTYGSGYQGFSRSPQRYTPYSNPSRFKNAIPSSLPPLGAAHPVAPQPYLYPNPMPYPRPHP